MPRQCEKKKKGKRAMDEAKDFNQNFVPIDAEHGPEKQKSPEKEKSPEKMEEDDVPKQPGTKRKKSIPRKIPREEAPIEIESLSTKFPIVDWKTCVLTETFMYYQVFRGDGSSKNYKILSEMLEDFDRMDVEELFRLVKERYSTSAPEGFDLMLWGDLHTLFEPDKDDEIWRDQHEYNLLSWRLCDFCGIHILLMDNGLAIHMLTEKKYPLSQEMLTKMLSRKLEVDHESSQAFELLRFIRSQVTNSLYYKESIKAWDQQVPITIQFPKPGIGGTRKSNRIPKLSHAHKSPYYKRQVSIEDKLHHLEIKVSSCIFAASGEPNEFIFETNKGLEVYRAIFESLRPKCEIHAGIIDLWSRKLNEEERHRNPNSPSRLFCHTGVLTAKMVKQPLGDFSLFHVFKQEMDRILKTYNEQINEFDMVFFLIILHKHFFLLCFDLKHDCYGIIDNMATGDLFKYENVPIKLKELFMEYLSSMKHPNESTMRNVWPRRLEMAWRTTNNNKDCSVFVMRHMETYDGTILASWNPGLKPEGAGQDAQLDDLRKKYVTRLLV
ncbi:ulp1 protease family, C-terminal catalytic domain-containing protein [Tanacetum coccineum]